MVNQVDINQLAADVISDFTIKAVGKIFSKGKDIFTDQMKKTQVDFNLAFANYLKKTYDKYSTVKTILHNDSPQYIYDVYECNALSYNDDRCPYQNNLKVDNINEILDITNYIYISGTAGSGKTTMLKHLFINAIKTTDMIPIFIELRRINNSDVDLFEYIYRNINDLGFNLEKKYLEYAFKAGSFILMFDGFDEVEKTEKVYNEINSMIDRYWNNYFIITSRPGDSYAHWNPFTIFFVNPFTKTQALKLVEKINYDEEIKSGFLKQLEIKLFDRHQSFASNPLLLNIMLLTFNSYSHIPDKLHIFYSNAFDTLFERHDSSKGVYRRMLHSGLLSDEFKRVLAELCFRTYIKKAFSFSKYELQEYLKDIQSSQKINSGDYINDLVTNVCVLFIDGLDYSFTHRSFQEYFTVLFLKDLSDDKQKMLCKKMLNSDLFSGYDMVLDMLFDLNSERFEKNIIVPFIEDIEKINTIQFYKKYFSYAEITESGKITYYPNERHYIIGFILSRYRNIDTKIFYADRRLTEYIEINYKKAKSSNITSTQMRETKLRIDDNVGNELLSRLNTRPDLEYKALIRIHNELITLHARSLNDIISLIRD